MPGDGRRGHKDLQLCKQVEEAISLALADYEDPLLDQLVLDSVIPAPSAARVEVRFVPTGDNVDLDAALARLNEVAGELREEVAAEVSRRRVPELVFRIVPRMPTLPPLDSKPPPE
jgi:ribosome-binding factor A